MIVEITRIVAIVAICYCVEERIVPIVAVGRSLAIKGIMGIEDCGDCVANISDHCSYSP